MTILALAIKALAALAAVFLVLRAAERFTNRFFLYIEQFGRTGDPANIAALKLDIEKRRLELDTEIEKARQKREALTIEQAQREAASARDPYDG